jgi:hypothetical protein
MLINGLPLPKLLMEMLEQGRWKHPGDEVLRSLIPGLYEPTHDPVDFLQSVDSIARNSPNGPIGGKEMMNTYKEKRGSGGAVPELPWVDVEKRLLVAVCKWPGDDVGIALDYRTSVTDPSVVALCYGGDGIGFYWTRVSDSFTKFVECSGL